MDLLCFLLIGLFFASLGLLDLWHRMAKRGKWGKPENRIERDAKREPDSGKEAGD